MYNLHSVRQVGVLQGNQNLLLHAFKCICSFWYKLQTVVFVSVVDPIEWKEQVISIKLSTFSGNILVLQM